MKSVYWLLNEYFAENLNSEKCLTCLVSNTLTYTDFNSCFATFDHSFIIYATRFVVGHV